MPGDPNKIAPSNEELESETDNNDELRDIEHVVEERGFENNIESPTPRRDDGHVSEEMPTGSDRETAIRDEAM